jgi:hypothetical protein
MDHGKKPLVVELKISSKKYLNQSYLLGPKCRQCVSCIRQKPKGHLDMGYLVLTCQ